MTQRHDGRANDEMRSIQFERGFTCHAEGSVLVSVGRTKVLCTASVSPTVPKFLNDKNEVQQTSLRWYVKKVLSQKQSVLK